MKTYLTSEQKYLERINENNTPEQNHAILQLAINTNKVNIDRSVFKHNKEERELRSSLKAAWKYQNKNNV